jgi:hypothetical protein
MLLTKNDLDTYLKYRNITISKEFTDELLKRFGKPFMDDAGHNMEYSEQDISEQLRKSIQKYIDGGSK